MADASCAEAGGLSVNANNSRNDTPPPSVVVDKVSKIAARNLAFSKSAWLSLPVGPKRNSVAIESKPLC